MAFDISPRASAQIVDGVVLIDTTRRVVEWMPQHERTRAHAEGRT